MTYPPYHEGSLPGRPPSGVAPSTPPVAATPVSPEASETASAIEPSPLAVAPIANRRCPNCGAAFGAGAAFCATCGQSLLPKVPPPSTDPVIELARTPYLAASFGTRLKAWVLDSVIWGALSAVAARSDATRIGLVVISAVVLWLFESAGWSPGKWSLHLRVLRSDGNPPGLVHGLVRSASKTLSILSVYGIFSVKRDPRRQAWHDKLADTYVVRLPGTFAAPSLEPGVRAHPMPWTPGVALITRKAIGWRAIPAGVFALGSLALGLAAGTLALAGNVQASRGLAQSTATPPPPITRTREMAGEFIPLHLVPTAPLSGIGPVPANAPIGCAGPGRRVCFVVVGTPPDVPVEEIAAHYSRPPLNLQTGILPPIALRDSVSGQPIVNALRDQLEANAVLQLVHATYPTLWSDRDVTVVALTGYDLRLQARPDWQFVFGATNTRTGGGGFGLVSDARMNEVAFGGSADPALLEKRLNAMTGNYVGMLYFGLAASDDPRSPVFASISGPDDLDNMAPLDLALGHRASLYLGSAFDG